MSERVEIKHWLAPGRSNSGAPWDVVTLKCAPTWVERIVPPAGEAYAFDVQHYRREIEVYVSPTGRSVRVFVNGVEVSR